MPTTLTTIFLLSIFISPQMTEKTIDDYNEHTYQILEDDLTVSLSRTDSAIAMAEDLDYEFGKAYALFQKGYLFDEQNESGKALLANLKALKILSNIDGEEEDLLSIKLYINTGLLLSQHYKYDEAIQYYKEGLQIAERYRLQEWIAEYQYKIGYAFKKQGNLDFAAEWFVHASKSSANLEDDYIYVNSLNMLGLTFSANEDYPLAREYFGKVLEHSYKNISQSKYHGKAYHNIANTYQFENLPEKSEKFFLKSLKEKEKRNKGKELFITRLDLADLYLTTGQLAKAEVLALTCESMYDELKNKPENYKLFSLLRKIDYKKGNYIQAEAYAERYEKENQLFINQQQQLIRIRDQFKMDMLTASYFNELERDRQIAQLTNSIYLIVLFIFIGFTLWKIRQLYVKRMLERELRTAIRDFNIDDL
ncbi:MAG: tetratricopeptide repeat protein [Cyclobacteriaceae bacterium]